ncbi:HAD family hydrolase [Chloroflexia bacterium SDU3-3]|nr:HAD family hydrolase [Chloroflexia bacterium SDU3-3]
MAQFESVILDVDGTLVDSNDAHARAWVEAFGELGIDADMAQVRSLIGKGSDHLIPEVCGAGKDSPEGRRVSERRGQIFRERYLPQLRAFPAARALAEALRGRGLRLAVASSAQADELGALLKIAGVDDLIERETSSDDAERSKPDPDIVQAALERLGSAPERTLMLGDTPYDVEAAARAGVASIALRCGGWGDNQLRGAAAVYQDPADLLARLDSSPLGEQ